MDDADIQRNREQQAQLYGAPLAVLCGRVHDVLGLNQARTAEVLGLSRPMMSQLISAQRVKIGNPAVLHRLQMLGDLCDEIDQGRVQLGDVPGRLGDISGTAANLARSTQASTLSDPAVRGTRRPGPAARRRFRRGAAARRCAARDPAPPDRRAAAGVRRGPHRRGGRAHARRAGAPDTHNDPEMTLTRPKFGRVRV